MWICTKYGFFSVVRANNEERLLVRARKKGHLEKLLGKAVVFETPDRDYRYRAFVSREDFARIMEDEIGDINYTNFKNSVKDDRLHDLYTEFWMLHHRYQEEREYDQPTRRNPTRVKPSVPGTRAGTKSKRA
jgi:hypothetical protein